MQPCRNESAPLWLDALPLLVQVRQQAVIMLVEQVAGERRQAGEDVTGAGGVLAALQPRAELACRGRMRGAAGFLVMAGRASVQDGGSAAAAKPACWQEGRGSLLLGRQSFPRMLSKIALQASSPCGTR